MIVTDDTIIEPTKTEEIYQLLTGTLDKYGFRPFGSDGTTFEHPSGIKVSTGYAGGRLRLRRHVGTERIVWDIAALPSEAEVVEFFKLPGTASALSNEELNRLAHYELSDEAPESLRQRVIAAIGDEMDAFGMSPGRFYASALADAALAVVRNEL